MYAVVVVMIMCAIAMCCASLPCIPISDWRARVNRNAAGVPDSTNSSTFSGVLRNGMMIRSTGCFDTKPGMAWNSGPISFWNVPSSASCLARACTSPSGVLDQLLVPLAPADEALHADIAGIGVFLCRKP